MDAVQAVAKRYSIAYYYVSPEDLECIKAFLALSGDSEKSLITQFVRGWLSKNRDYYLDLASRDSEARQIPFSQWAETVYNEGFDALPNYKQSIGEIPPNPLRDVVLPVNVERRQISYITLGVQNYCLFLFAINFDREGAVRFVSRVVKEHLQRNWEKLYAPQVAAENFQNWDFRRSE